MRSDRSRVDGSTQSPLKEQNAAEWCHDVGYALCPTMAWDASKRS